MAYQLWLDMLRGLLGVPADAPGLAVRDALKEWMRVRCPARFDLVYPLRLQWRAGQVAASCSADGAQWFAVGRTPFAAQGPIQVGVHAIGNIERTIYRGAYPEGTAIRFSSFGLWSAWGVDDDLDLGRP